MQNILVYIIIAAAVIYSVVAIVKRFRNSGCSGDNCDDCSCGGNDDRNCDGCK